MPAAAHCERGVQMGVNMPLLKASSVAAALVICCPSVLDASTGHVGRLLAQSMKAVLSNMSAAEMVEPIGSGVKTEPVATFNLAAMSWWARMRLASPPLGGVFRIASNCVMV